MTDQPAESQICGSNIHEHRPHAPALDYVSDFEALEVAVRELCLEKGIFTAADFRAFAEFAEKVGPTPASHLVAKCWLDDDFKAFALEQPIAACKTVGVDWMQPTGFGTPSDFTALHILEDTPNLHHVIVCTLCSCYPRPLLGNSPEWYRTPNYRRRLVRHPRDVLAEFGTYLPAEVEIRVEDSNQKHRFMVLPVRPAGTEDWDEDRLAEIATRDTMIGVALPQPGVTANVTADRVRKARRGAHHD
ncbi:thiocyanate hydrolase subunit gamma [Mycobacterium sp. M1]|uniref:Thiocyanate hydrolase subunit gamma n=1 Tax=Mycolicibacter acidiphilus TaxID=2835306 RepID=A0ABS5RRF1_9MYCO|nr:thiocyanate hydrolase subunit gamma [Mycolicibacter acidiphilus]MBS9536108.1 thiocyanate hydrolase subunit gamma [Mycolicibacter acidiphilus]